ncbi:Transcriptional regulatory protein DegU [Paraliobacillus sp. PM-2]|uniref:response regulator transcription factor n=1 Tax=Paraliobacillus sp. PM-2 TaxID=1462524 RepID=UPI00061CCFB3|nr:response regulator transcription factor [Paraliobacillus sp. PM-2]CQR47415.1 Transcriptional regulatory protein DegU [Paraliobacillus sp. PM-2]
MSSKQIKLMIADDFQLLVEEMEHVINNESDMEIVATANSGKEIVELAKHIDFDFILMDIEMENTTAGIQATERIRAFNREAKIIFLSVHETKEMILTAMGTGAIDYIVKGSPNETVLKHIRSAYEGKPLMEAKIQALVMQEYKRLQQSEKSFLYFVNRIPNLTRTERELISYLLQKMTVREIAKERGVEIVTIKSQINRLLKKFEVSRTKEIVKQIKELNLTHLF